MVNNESNRCNGVPAPQHLSPLLLMSVLLLMLPWTANIEIRYDGELHIKSHYESYHFNIIRRLYHNSARTN